MNHGSFGKKNLWRARRPATFACYGIRRVRSPGGRGGGPGAVGSPRHLPLRPRCRGSRFQRGHAAALRLGGAPARGARDELLPAGLHRPLPADARRAGVLPDRVRRQRPADRTLRRAGLRRAGGGHAAGRVRRALPGRDQPHRGAVRGPVAAARALARLVAALLHHRRALPADRADQLRHAARGGPRASGAGPDPVVHRGPHLARPGRRGGPGADEQAAHDRLHRVRRRAVAHRHHQAGAASGLRGAVPPPGRHAVRRAGPPRRSRCSATRCRCSPTPAWTRSTAPG